MTTRWLAPITLVVCTAALYASPAQAWEHTGWALAPEDLPLRVTIEPNADVAGLTPEQAVEDLERALQQWSDASCGFEAIFAGVAEYDDPTDVPAGELHLSFAPLGADAARFVRLGGLPELEDLYTRRDRVYSKAQPGSWVINTSGGFRSDEEILAGDCPSGRSLSTVAGVLVGYSAGLGPSRSPFALMASRLNNCELVAPGPDDIEGLHTLYGPWVDFTCDADATGTGEDVPGVVPLDVTCTAVAGGTSQITDASWTFGDGTEGSGNPVQHTYTSDDNYSVVVEAALEHPSCGTTEASSSRSNYVRACAEPRPDFRVERDRGLFFRLVNASDVRTFGCHDDIRWEVIAEGGETVLESTTWEPLVELPDEGVYRVRLTLSGLAGATTVEDDFNTRDGSVRAYSVGNGCSSTGLGGLGWLSLAGLSLVLWRRRR